jgi:hypothetical protein
VSDPLRLPWHWHLHYAIASARHWVAFVTYRAITGHWPCDCECPSCQHEEPER